MTARGAAARQPPGAAASRPRGAAARQPRGAPAGAVILCSLAVAALGATGSVPPTAVLAALYLACTSVAGICSMSLRQQVTPDHLLGRVTAAFWTIHFSLGPVGAALLTWTAGHFGVMAACLASGATCLLIGTAALLTPIRRGAPEPGAAAA